MRVAPRGGVRGPRALPSDPAPPIAMTDSLAQFLFGPAPVVWVQQTLGPGWPFPWRVVSLLGVSWGVILALGLSLWLWGREVTWSLAGVVVLQGLTSLVLNQFFDTPRPDHPAIVKHERIGVGSFPSGHLLTTTLVWGWLYVRGRLPLPLLAAIVAAMALSRLYLGVHFVGDLLGSLAIAVPLLWGYRRLWPRLRAWLERRSPGFFTALALVPVAGAVAAVTVIEPGNPFVWNAAGVMAAAGPALLLEHRRVELAPPRGSGPRRVGVGAAGIVALVVPWWAAGESAHGVAALCTAAATAWALLAAPALFRAGGNGPPRADP